LGNFGEGPSFQGRKDPDVKAAEYKKQKSWLMTALVQKPQEEEEQWPNGAPGMSALEKSKRLLQL
jgi:hypothetical protein